MKAFQGGMGYDVWQLVVTSYTPTKIPPKYVSKKELKRKNKLEMEAILEGLSNAIKDKIRKCTPTKDIWDKLKNLYMVEEVIKAREE